MINKKFNTNYIEKRRSVRIRRSRLLKETSNIEYKIATTTDELEQAFELVTQQYFNVGLHKNNNDLRLTKYHLLPDTKIFIAIKKHEDMKETVIGTITMVVDKSMGLPMDELYNDQLNRMRTAGLQLSELISLSVAPQASAQQNNIVVYLFKICMQYAHMTNVHDILCSVTEKHIKFYRELLLFTPLGELLPYSFANDQLIQGHRLNLQQGNEDFRKVYSGMEFDADLHRFFFTETRDFNRPKGEGTAMTPEQIRYFIEKRTRLLSSLTKKDKRILREEFTAQHKIFSY
ncbi:hypothetical protein MNBD_GAMMA09-2627 [hydrothermal vent metagenome]|uniref:N-acyl amino acid synthase FeeM catalytic core domain-containing protein n=1 Tax=hydrothermal vent metagenome TaxID=652676 RepID=A0A3B0XI80_9ZZZZ